MDHEWQSKGTMQFDTAMLSDKGMVRENNEDSCFVLETSESTDSGITYYGLYLVADGMGGHQAGEVASAKAVEIISSAILEKIRALSVGLSFPQIILMAIEKANNQIYNIAQTNPAFSGMGTTVTLGLRVDNQLYLGHVGDSRAYLVRGGEIVRLTRDHSVVEGLVRAGMITQEEAKHHPDRHKIFRCLGNSPNVFIDTYKEIGNEDSLIIRGGDNLIFCSDGLTSCVSDNEILAVVVGAKSAHYSCEQLVSMANEEGSKDNISIIVVKSRGTQATTRLTQTVKLE